MLRNVRFLPAVLSLIVGTGVLVHWIMGQEFGPWVETAKLSARDQLRQLVDQYTLELQKARTEVTNARERAVELRLHKHKTAAKLKTLQRRKLLAQRGLEEATTQLTALRDQIESQQPIRYVGTQRVATKVELQGIVERCSGKIEIAQERVGYLNQIQLRCEERYQKLVELDQQSPLAIQRLNNSVEFLAEKLALYQDVKNWVDEDQAADAHLAGLYEKAERTLQTAHTKLDAKLAEVDAILEFTLETEADFQPVPETESMDTLLLDIRSTLENVNVASQP